MSITISQHTDQFSTAPQLGPEHLAAVAAAGFRSVINNRPDGEGGPEQPTSEQMRTAALACGLQYVHQPVVSGMLSPDDARAFAEHLKSLPGPVLAFCRSGTRSTILYRMSQEPGYGA